MAWGAGQRLQNGKYTIDRILGIGGIGITYLAWRRDGQRFVIKTLNDTVRLRPELANFQTRIQQDFLNEALRLAKCNHPNIVRVEELIREDSLDCIVMEYIDGENLATHVIRQGILPESEALHYIQQVGEALSVVHRQGVLHRDIKPNNNMIRVSNHEAVLIDFGLSRGFIQDLTQTHTESRTDGFAPLEQYDRRAKRGAYTDVYALAATLYCLLTRRIPRPAPIRATGTPLEPPKVFNSRISDRVNEAVLKGMELRVEDRPHSIQAWFYLLGILPSSTSDASCREPRTQETIALTPTRAENINRILGCSQSAFSSRPEAVVPSLRPLSYRQRILSLISEFAGFSRQSRGVALSQRRSLPWIWLTFAFIGHATLGAFFMVSAAPLWAWTLAVTVAIAASGAVVVARAAALAGVGGATVGVIGGAIAAAAAAMSVIGGTIATAATVIAMEIAVAGTAAAATAIAEVKLLNSSFSRFYAFLIVTATSALGLGVGFLAGMMIRLSDF